MTKFVAVAGKLVMVMVMVDVMATCNCTSARATKAGSSCCRVQHHAPGTVVSTGRSVAVCRAGGARPLPLKAGQGRAGGDGPKVGGRLPSE